MDYQFYVVGKKNSDCFVVYDAREGMGGRACASKYTLAQLITEGYAVCGVPKKIANGKSLSVKDVVVMTLQGTPAVSISQYPNVPDTKRSLSTFIKGIKRNKEEIAKAKQTGEKRSASIQQKKEKIPEIVSFFKEYASDGFKKGRITASKAVRIYNYNRPETERVDDFETLFDKKGNTVGVYYNCTKKVVVTSDEILAKYNQIIGSMHIGENGYISYSFTGRRENTPKEIVEYVLKTTKKPFKYTYGFKYRNPTTYMVPITRESALEKLKDWCDVTEFNDYIDINTYSSNDMW